MKITTCLLSVLSSVTFSMAFAAPVLDEPTVTTTMSAPVAPSATGSPVTTGSTISAPVETAVSKKKSKIKTTSYVGVWGSVRDVNLGNTEGVGTDLFIQGLKDIGGRQALGVRINGAVNQTNHSSASKETALTDPQIIYTNPFYGSYMRLSFPVSEISQKIGRYEFRYNGGSVLYKQGRFTLGAGPEARVTAYTVENDGNRYFRFRGILSPDYKVNKNFSIFSNLIYDVRHNHSGRGWAYLNPSADLTDPSTKRNPRQMARHGIFDLGFTFNLFQNKLMIQSYVEQNQQFESKAPLTLFNPDTTGYNLEFTLTI